MDLLSWQTPDGFRREVPFSSPSFSNENFPKHRPCLSLPIYCFHPWGTGMSNLIIILEELLGLLVQLCFFLFGMNLPREYNIFLYCLSCPGLPWSSKCLPVGKSAWSQSTRPPDLKATLPDWSSAATKLTPISSTCSDPGREEECNLLRLL